MPGRRLRASLEIEADAVAALAFAPDGRTVAVAGRGKDSRGRAWLYDLAEMHEEPIPSANAMALDRWGFPAPDGDSPRRRFHDLAFTPDGRNLVAISSATVVIWDAATGARRDFIDREPGLLEDGLDVSPDGRWLALPGSQGISLIDLGPATP